MGCRITVSQHDPNEEAKTTSKITEGLAEGGPTEDQAKDSGSKYSENFDGSKTTEDPKTKEVPERVPATTSDITLLSLPTEMLVKIISILETRDRVKLRYVSKKIRHIGATPSFWRDFVWPDCISREERCLHNVMKSYGVHVRQLSFPQCQTQHIHRRYTRGNVWLWKKQEELPRLVYMSEMAKMLQFCSNLTYLRLPNLDHQNSDLKVRQLDHMQLREAIQEMKHLEVLEIWESSCSLLQQYFNLNIALKEFTIRTWHPKEASETWMINGFTPPKLDLVVLHQSCYREFLLSNWDGWNSKIPAGHIACLKVYTGRYKVPLNLFNNAPMFQLQYGEGATLPFVQLSSIDINEKFLLLLTDLGGGSKMVQKARVYNVMNPSREMQIVLRDHEQDKLDNDITNLTELDLCGYNVDFKQIVGVCPWLQRLNLRNNVNLKLEDVQVIAACCSNLRGLNLMGMLIQDIKFCLQVWEILSGMMLTHLSINTSFVGDFIEKDYVQERQLVALFKQCITLQALELVVKNSSCELLSHFSSLRYCRVITKGQSTCMQDILATCKQLRYFYYAIESPSDLPPLLVQNNLQQLCISNYPRFIHFDDDFMEMVSAHGGLIHVIFCVDSVTSKGVATLIKNSPNLLSFILCEGTLNMSLKTSLRKKFSHRKLFISGVFEHTRNSHVNREYQLLKHTDLMALWPPTR